MMMVHFGKPLKNRNATGSNIQCIAVFDKNDELLTVIYYNKINTVILTGLLCISYKNERQMNITGCTAN
jgi:hypothetical protein